MISAEEARKQMGVSIEDYLLEIELKILDAIKKNERSIVLSEGIFAKFDGGVYFKAPESTDNKFLNKIRDRLVSLDYDVNFYTQPTKHVEISW